MLMELFSCNNQCIANLAAYDEDNNLCLFHIIQ